MKLISRSSGALVSDVFLRACFNIHTSSQLVKSGLKKVWSTCFSRRSSGSEVELGSMKQLTCWVLSWLDVVGVVTT